ncbi:hypothetical protein GWI33_006336 [Rhynchophorus ferrugineus]|uniref:Uncharacterized protein n=1 Tax=Rhynchophorus ferrugineus TaxID=354439 RepID=A0A834IG33_RHYFE|nr:hypothetical protein GWI33_006336 [Rhynchophorus ferrugineus]
MIFGPPERIDFYSAIWPIEQKKKQLKNDLSDVKLQFESGVITMGIVPWPVHRPHMATDGRGQSETITARLGTTRNDDDRLWGGKIESTSSTNQFSI